jgi:hypothetical protein
MRRIEAEAKRFPWINNGLVSLIMAQLRGNSQGAGGGNPGASPADNANAALDTMTGDGGGGSGALNFDGGMKMLPHAPGQRYGGA